MKKHQPEASEGRSNSKSTSGRKPDALREQAERRLSERSTPMRLQDARKVLHELEVHQIELEMQNEALRQTQAMLIASQEKYTDLYDFAPVGYFTFDHMGLISEVNLAGASLLGIERSQLTGKPFSLFVTASSRETFHRHYRDVLKTGVAGTCELQLTRKDGTSFFALVQSMPVREAQGNPTGVRSAIGDITERRQAEEAFKKTHDELEVRVQERTAELQRQAELLNLTQDAIIACNLGRRILFWNRGAEERYGWSSDEVKEKVTDDLLRTVYLRPRQEIEQELLIRGRWEGERIDTTRDGRKVIVASRQALRRDEEGRPIAILELNSDITEQKRADEERQRLAVAVEHTGEAVLIIDSGFIIRYVNPAFIRATGYSREEAVGRDAKLLMSDPDFSGQLRKMLTAGHPWSGVYPLRHKDGPVLPARTSIASIKDASGTITYFVVVAHDITEQQKVEGQLRQAQKMEAIGTLAGGIAHDFNNILAAIIGFTELSVEDAPEGSPIRRNMTNVLKAAIRGRDLVRQILTFSRMSDPERAPLHLTAVVAETFKLLRAFLPSTITMKLQTDATSDEVVAQSTEISQLLMNLGTNAAYAMRENGGHLEISLGDIEFHPDTRPLHPDLAVGAYVELSVKDTGCGMDADTKNRIFEPFFTTKERGQGTGLGLAVVHGIVQSLQGAVTVSSEPGRGSTFTVFLPKVASDKKAQPEMTGEIVGGKECVLFVDDEELLVEMAKEMLGRLGYEVVATTDSAEALSAFSGEPDRFQCVISDYTMPRMTGTALAKELMKIRPNVPVILCTGYTEMISREETHALGIREFVMKPLVKREIAETIRRVLDTKARD